MQAQGKIIKSRNRRYAIDMKFDQSRSNGQFVDRQLLLKWMECRGLSRTHYSEIVLYKELGRRLILN